MEDKLAYHVLAIMDMLTQICHDLLDLSLRCEECFGGIKKALAPR